MPSLSTLKKYDSRRLALQKIADETIAAIDKGFILNGITYNLRANTDDSKRRTRYFAPDSLLSAWTITPIATLSVPTQISILEISTLQAAHHLASRSVDADRIGILNFASAKKPGGGFLNGAQAQEESIARSSTLYPTLMTNISQNFYTLHNHDAKAGYYTHAAIYSPSVVIFRDDDGGWQEPFEVDVLTSPAVNAGNVRKSLLGRLAVKETEEKIERVMKERMGRILFLFEKEGVKDIVLGSFGTGVFQNKIDVVARLWADLLTVPGSRFEKSFRHVIFAILGKQTFNEFEDVFHARTTESRVRC